MRAVAFSLIMSLVMVSSCSDGSFDDQHDARIYELLDRESVQALVKQHLDGEQNRRLLIWSLLNVEQWLAAH